MSVKEVWEQEVEPEREEQVQDKGDTGELKGVVEDTGAGEIGEEGESEDQEEEGEVKGNTPMRRSPRVRRGVHCLDL